MNKNKKGFTLVELLAVIVVLAVIATIIVPNVMVVLRRSEKDSFEQSAHGILTSAKSYYQEKSEDEEFDGRTFDFKEATELSFDGKKPTGGTVTVTADGNVELYITDGKYCAIKETQSSEITVLDLDEVENCGGEMVPPTIKGFVVDEDSITASSFKVIAAAEDTDSGINKYEFYIEEVSELEDEETEIEETQWVSSKTGIYEFTNLKNNTKYRVKMRVQNNNGIKAYSDTDIEVETGNIAVICTVDPATDTWEANKTVNIQYSEDVKYTKQYSRDNGKTWKTSEESTTSLKFTSPGSVLARVSDGTNKTTVMCVVSKVDSSAPIVTGSLIESNGLEGTITIGAYASDPESGITKYEYAISDTLISTTDTATLNTLFKESASNAYKFTDLTANTTYYVYIRATNAVGKTTISDVVEAKVSDLDQPTCEIDKSGYTNTGKTVTVTYPVGYTNEYRVASNAENPIAKLNGAILESNKWIITANKSESILLQAAGDVYARIKTDSGKTSQTVCSVSGIDLIAPTLSVVSKPLTGDWYNKDKEIILTKADTGGAGLKAYYISKNNATPNSTSSCKGKDQDDEWVCDSAATLTIRRGLDKVPTEGPQTYYLWVMDAAGNVSDRRTLVIDNIEQTKPTCELKVKTGTKGTNNWYTSDVEVEITVKDDKGSKDYSAAGVDSYGFATNQTGTRPAANYAATSKVLTLKTDGTNYVYGYVKDKAGNINECGALVVKIDETKPTCGITGQNVTRDDEGSIVGTYTYGKWTNYNVKAKVTATDETSKVDKIVIKPGGAVGTKNVTYADENEKEKSETYLLNKEGLSTITSTVTDYAGNSIDCTTVDIKADYTKPQCAIEVASGDMGANDWYIGDVQFKWTSKTDALSGMGSYGIGLKETFANNATYILNANSPASGTTVYGYVKDVAGNINNCSKTVKRDASAPEISAKAELTSYTSSDANKDIISYFNLTYGKSGGTVVCKLGDQTITKVSELGTHKRVNVTCTATSGSGLKKSATTAFRYYYAGTIHYYCDGGWSLSGATCSKGNSGADCGRCGTGYNYSTGCNSCSWVSGSYACNCFAYACNCSTFACNCTSRSCNCRTNCGGYVGRPAFCATTCSTCTSCSTCVACSTCTSCSTCYSYSSGSNCGQCGSYEYVSSTYCHSCSWTDYKSAYSYYTCDSKGTLSGAYCYF